ncbi:UvrD-helicase domain-containing protein [Sedimentimonas flavescens]|uniref:UvrD-helicase domain-containing protein n=1 Tax=Sedimentimonas flavescens TaxID=2851012 RepID=UPI001C4A61A7|nr:UvrD-helicase domain-containing protein [Sedimentimonas flavescens]MBW0159656.1 UvrD-helicase domain-containing protein [Sedimentimonas flavescens]
MDNGLVIVPAGAGAGKTHRIKSQLSDWVKRGIVRPERILAVTFTEAAAGELRERIRAGLLADGLVAEAMAVERAYVSTIHGLGLRLLTEHALAAGASPQPRHLGDAERDLLIRQALAHAKALDPIKAEPERFGYEANWQKGETVEDSLRSRVLAMIDLLRGLGDKGRDPGLVSPALARLDEVYGQLLDDPAADRDRLLSTVLAMLGAFPEGGMAGVTAKGPRETLEKNFAFFQRVQRDPALLDRDWGLWQSLRSLFISNSRTKTPEGYDELAVAIMEAANVLPVHPGPLADAKLHLQCLIACAQEVMDAYETRKKSLGLIDFADMISGAERLLRTDPTVRQAVLDEIDCVIIDEFQDTNPVQFALLWQLGAQAPRTLLVGDVKQSIMGFQGADPRLSQALTAANPTATQPLDRNWRSSPAVMEFVNAMGEGLFGTEYNPLTPTREAVPGPALELLNAAKGRAVRTASKPPEHIAERITRILTDGEAITDRHTKTVRSARPSDIALLVCRHTTAARYAAELRARGVPVRIAEDGWADSPVVQAARAALSYAANPADIHSGLLLRTLGPDPLPLHEALIAQIDARLSDDPVLMQLGELSNRLSGLPVSAALDLVLDAAGLRLWAARQPDAAQARADLLRLEAEAEAFETAHRDLKAASGFHGETAKVFLGWLDTRAGERDFDRRPDPSANSADAVEIVTWHASKGREWPITVVAEFDAGIEERAGTTSTRFEALEQIDDMAAVLASAALIHTPGFAAPEATRRFIEDRRPDFEANAKNLLYVALTRARDRLVLEWPAFLKERDEETPEAKTLFHVFEDACAPQVGGGRLRLGSVDCPSVIRDLPDQAGFTEYAVKAGAQRALFGASTPLALVPLTPWRLQPSQAVTASLAPESRGVILGVPWTTTINDAARGTALHLALHTGLKRPDLVSCLPAATGLDDVTLAGVLERAEALKAWLTTQGYTELHCEIPVLGHTPEGAEILGTIDLLAIGSDGSLLIDHKSGGSGVGLGPYWPQLSAYAALIPQLLPNCPLRGAAVFWVDHGRLELVELSGTSGAELVNAAGVVACR